MAANDYIPTPKDFYVYEHRKATTGEVFYVGKGVGRRAWDLNRRNQVWHRITAKHGVDVVILQDGLQEWAAFELERDRIALHGYINAGTGPLCNMTDGGDGTVGYKFSDAQMAGIKATRKTPAFKSRMNAIVSKRESSGWREKQKAGIRAALCEPIVCTTFGYAFASTYDAADWLRTSGQNIPASGHTNISAALNGKTSTAYGLRWAYKTQYHDTIAPTTTPPVEVLKTHKRKRHMINVRCDTTGDIFDSYVAAASWLTTKTGSRVPPNIIRNAAVRGQTTRGVFTFSVVTTGVAA